jgi:hypothetical protein
VESNSNFTFRKGLREEYLVTMLDAIEQFLYSSLKFQNGHILHRFPLLAFLSALVIAAMKTLGNFISLICLQFLLLVRASTGEARRVEQGCTFDPFNLLEDSDSRKSGKVEANEARALQGSFEGMERCSTSSAALLSSCEHD